MVTFDQPPLDLAWPSCLTNANARSMMPVIALKEEVTVNSPIMFQNTPAQFHGRPELVQQLTEELRQLL